MHGTAGIIAVGLVTAAGMLTARPAVAAAAPPVTVPCSATALASAMTSATAGETLRLARSCQYVLTAALPEVSQDLTIEGNGATLERSTAAGTPDFAIITVTGGAFTGNAGGAINFGSIEGGDLTVTKSAFTANTRSGISCISGAENCDVSVTGSTFTGNTGSAMNDNFNPAGFGVTDSTFIRNTGDFGGAISSGFFGGLGTSGDTFTGNTATRGG